MADSSTLAHPPPSFSGEPWRRLHVAVQRTRALVYGLLYSIGLAGVGVGAFEFDPKAATVLLTVSLVSVAVFDRLYRRLAEFWEPFLTSAWMGLDVVVITWALYLARDPAGIWPVWYLSNAAAAAFVAGRRAVIVVALANSCAFLVMLFLAGDIGLGGEGLTTALFRLALLWGASFIFLRGIADLRQKRIEIGQLLEEKEHRKKEVGSLNRTVDRQTQELEIAQLKCMEASRAKSQFLANMSHELRTPLNSIIGFSEILEEKTRDQIDPRYGKFLHNIHESGRRLLGLINDILDLSKIEAGKMEVTLERVSLRDVAEGVRSVVLGVAGKRGITVSTQIPQDLPTVIADGPKVKQVLYNLVSNAVKFSPDNSTVEIIARSFGAEDSPLGEAGVELAVKDHGIGIELPDHQQIFDEFFQVDGATNRARGGAGLGLALVKRFTEMHGGKVEVESMSGAGSTFRIFLPLDASQVMLMPGTSSGASSAFPIAKGHLPGESASSSRPTVLLVEDDDTFYEALAGDLTAAGYSPHRARHGEEALQQVKEVKPEVITLDLALPGMDGWEVLKILKSEPDTATIPVVIVSLVENHELGFALGAVDYFLKPLDRRHFLHRLEQVLGSTSNSPRRTALVVDDDSHIHQLLETELKAAGYQVLTAHDGPTGLRLALEQQPTVIVLDLMMPEMNGFEVAQKLREDSRTAEIPVVVLTAKDLTEGDRAQLSGRIEGLLSKAPMDRRLILQTIRTIERRKGSLRPQA